MQVAVAKGLDQRSAGSQYFLLTNHDQHRSGAFNIICNSTHLTLFTNIPISLS